MKKILKLLIYVVNEKSLLACSRFGQYSIFFFLSLFLSNFFVNFKHSSIKNYRGAAFSVLWNNEEKKKERNKMSTRRYFTFNFNKSAASSRWVRGKVGAKRVAGFGPFCRVKRCASLTCLFLKFRPFRDFGSSSRRDVGIKPRLEKKEKKRKKLLPSVKRMFKWLYNKLSAPRYPPPPQPTTRATVPSTLCHIFKRNLQTPRASTTTYTCPRPLTPRLAPSRYLRLTALDFEAQEIQSATGARLIASSV